MKKLLLIASITLLASTGYSQKDSANHHARQLLYLTGSDKLGLQAMNNIIQTFKKTTPSIPDKFWDEIMKEVSSQGFIDLLIPIYTKYYSDSELVELIKFYQTPVGQKLIEKMPLVAQDSFNAGQEWGKAIAEKAIIKLKEQGYIKNEAPNN